MNKASIWKALTPEQRQRLKEVLAKKGHVRDATEARVDFVDNQAPKLKVKYHNGSATRPPK